MFAVDAHSTYAPQRTHSKADVNRLRSSTSFKSIPQIQKLSVPAGTTTKDAPTSSPSPPSKQKLGDIGFKVKGGDEVDEGTSKVKFQEGEVVKVRSTSESSQNDKDKTPSGSLDAATAMPTIDKPSSESVDPQQPLTSPRSARSSHRKSSHSKDKDKDKEKKKDKVHKRSSTKENGAEGIANKKKKKHKHKHKHKEGGTGTEGTAAEGEGGEKEKKKKRKDKTTTSGEAKPHRKHKHRDKEATTAPAATPSSNEEGNTNNNSSRNNIESQKDEQGDEIVPFEPEDSVLPQSLCLSYAKFSLEPNKDEEDSESSFLMFDPKQADQVRTMFYVCYKPSDLITYLSY